MAIEFIASTQGGIDVSSPVPFVSTDNFSETADFSVTGVTEPGVIFIHLAIDLTSTNNAGVPLVISPPPNVTLLDSRGTSPLDDDDEVVGAVYYRVVESIEEGDESFFFSLNMIPTEIVAVTCFFPASGGRGQIDMADPVDGVVADEEDFNDEISVGSVDATTYRSLSMLFVSLRDDAAEAPSAPGYTVIHNLLNGSFILVKEIDSPGTVSGVTIDNNGVTTAIVAQHVVIRSIITESPSTMSLPVPGEVEEGDYAILSFMATRRHRHSGSPPTHPDIVFTVPGGFTALATTAVLEDELTDASKYLYLRHRHVTYGKFVESGDTAYDLSLTGDDPPPIEEDHNFGWRAVVLFYRGVDPGSPIADFATFDDATDGYGQVEITVGPVTPDGVDNMLVGFFAHGGHHGANNPNRLKVQSLLTEREFGGDGSPSTVIGFSAGDEELSTDDEVDSRSASLAPHINYIDPPDTGDEGDTITIYGENLDHITSITMNGIPVATFTPGSTAVPLVIPPGSVDGVLELTTIYGSVQRTWPLFEV